MAELHDLGRSLSVSFHPDGNRKRVHSAKMIFIRTDSEAEDLNDHDAQVLLRILICRTLRIIDEEPTNEAVEEYLNDFLDDLYYKVHKLKLNLPKDEV